MRQDHDEIAWSVIKKGCVSLSEHVLGHDSGGFVFNCVCCVLHVTLDVPVSLCRVEAEETAVQADWLSRHLA